MISKDKNVLCFVFAGFALFSLMPLSVCVRLESVVTHRNEVYPGCK